MQRGERNGILFLIALISVILLASVSPWLPLPESIVDFNRNWISFICHTSESRAFNLNDNAMILCSRCTGIYLSFGLGLIMSFFISFPHKLRNKRTLLLGISFGIILIDVILNALNIFSNTLWSRFVTGLIFGQTLSYFFFKTTKNGELSDGTKS